MGGVQLLNCGTTNNTNAHKYCAVAVASEAMDGAAPELNPGWVHRGKNSNSAVRHVHNRLARALCHQLLRTIT